MRRFAILFAAGLAAAAGLSLQADPAAKPAPLILTPSATIIVIDTGRKPEDVEAGKAARLLQVYLRKACRAPDGFRISGMANLPAGGRTAILAVGPTKWTDFTNDPPLWRDGFVIRRSDNVVGIRGGDGRGTFFGAVEFLNRFAGVRFYMPGDLWTSLPTNPAITLPVRIDIRSEPFVKIASMSGIFGDWSERNAANTRNGLAGTHMHNMNQVFPPSDYASNYPDIYPLVEGNRTLPKDAADQDWNPCLSSPRTLDAAEKSALAYFAKNPGLAWFSLGLQDSHAFCECAGCKTALEKLGREFADGVAAGNPGGRIVSTYTSRPEADAANPTQMLTWARSYALSQLQWKLVNDLAARLEGKAPGKRIEAMAYGITSFAPAFPMHTNAMVYSQIHVSDNIRGLMEPRPDGSLPIDRFIDATPAYGNHDWYHGVGHLAPRIYSGYWSKFMRHLKAKNKTFVAMHAETGPNWGLDGPKYWVLARTWWDPDSDPEALWRQFCDDMFGKAADPMFRYFRELERFFIDQSVTQGPKWKLYDYPKVFCRTPADLAKVRACRALLEEARPLLRTDEERARHELFSKTFTLTEYLFAVGVEGASPERIVEIRDYYRETIQPDPLTLTDKIREDGGTVANLLPPLIQGRRRP